MPTLVDYQRNVKLSGTYNTVAGTPQDITVPGVMPSDICFVTVNTVGAAPVTISYAKCGVNKITVGFSATPSTDHVLQFLVCRTA